MGTIHQHRPVLLIVAIISRHPAAMDWARDRVSRAWGPVGLASEVFDFVETSFYQESMGGDLKKQFLAFEQLVDPTALAEKKLQTNQWESDYAQSADHAEPRPLNLDPGYITEAKLVLATTKDRDHRLYLQQGIYAEVTLYFHKGSWSSRPWTYPDYQRKDFQQFFTQCRDYLRNRYRTDSELSA